MGTRPRLYLEIFLLCLAVLLLEVSYTRVFSFKLVYYFTYLIIGIALLGIGSGGVLVALAPRLRGAAVERLLPVCALVAALGVLGGYVVVARTQFNSVDLVEALVKLDARTSFTEGTKLAAICTALFVPFLAAGLAIAAIFASRNASVNRLYFADLLGAAVGCALSVPLMTWLSPPACVMLAGACFALAGLRLALAGVRLAVPGLVIASLAALVAALVPEHLPAVVTDRIKTMSPQQTPEIAFSRWHPVFRVDVLRNSEKVREGLMLAHDGMWGSVLPHYEGDPAALTRYDTDVRSVPFRVLAPAPHVAIIGAAGGNEILASLHFGAGHVDAVELNPVTVSLLTRYFADYSGHMAEDPHVTLLNAEGRGFLMRDDTRYDLIWFVAPDSYAAMNAATSGAYVLSESYLYTKEMLLEALGSLTPDGLVCTQFGEPSFERKPNRTARYLATVRAAFADLGVTDVARHVLVATTTGFVFTTSTILIKREPFTQGEIDGFVRTIEALPGGRVRHAPGLAPDGHPVSKILTSSASDLAAWFRSYPFDVRAVTDDAPFFWHFVRFRHALRRSAALRPASLEEGMGERLLVVLLVIATGFAAVFLLAPLALARRVWRTIPHKALAGTYFAALGFGFMFLEVSLIQRLTLFLGFPTYSLTVTLCVLLLATGLGSLASERLGADRRRIAVALGTALALLVVFYLLALGPIVRFAIAWRLLARAGLAAVMLAPLGLCLGMFMPLGLRTVAGLTPHAEAYVAWGWAVNGFCSVVASVLSTLLSMTFGFDVVMLLALAVYAVALVALVRLPAPPPAAAEV